MPSGEQSARGLLDEWPDFDRDLDPINRVFLPRADIATDTLVAGLQEMGWEVDDVTAYRTVRAAPPAAPVRDAIKNGSFDAVLFTSSSTVRNLVGIAGKPHPVDRRRLHRPGHRQDRRGARPAGRRARPGAHRRGPRRRPRRPRPLARARRAGGRRGRAAAQPAPSRRPPTGHLSVAGFPTSRPRRLRQSPAIRRLVAETRLHPAELVLPVFVREGISEPVAISAMPGVVQHTLDSLVAEARRCVEAGLGGIMVFGVPVAKDARGSGADDPDGILNVALARLVQEVGDDLVVMADLCLDEFTDHGHCGVLAADGSVDNDATLDRYASMALAQAATGAPVLGLSGMMDGQVGYVRAALDAAGYTDTVILAYAAKYTSGLTGRSARRCSPRSSATAPPTSRTPPTAPRRCASSSSTSRRAPTSSWSSPPGRTSTSSRPRRRCRRFPLRRTRSRGSTRRSRPPRERGWIDRDRVMMESLTGIRRAGASIILTYYALEAAARL